MSSKLRAGIVGLSGIAARLPERSEHPGMGVHLPVSHASAYYWVRETELVAGCDPPVRTKRGLQEAVV